MYGTRRSFDSQIISNYASGTANNKKFLASTNTSNGFPRVTQSAHMNRSSSSSFKNTKSKLDVLEETLQRLKNAINGLNMQTKQSKQYLAFIKDDLLQHQLPDYHSKLIQQLRKLSKMVKISQVSDQSRYDAINCDINTLRDSTKNIKTVLYQLENQLSSAQNVMGYYNAKQKHRY